MRIESKPKFQEKYLPLVLSCVLAFAFLIVGIIFAATPFQDSTKAIKQFVVVVTIFSSLSIALWAYYFRLVRESYEKIRLSQLADNIMSGLNPLAEKLVTDKTRHASDVARWLQNEGVYEVPKKSMYSELIQLCILLDPEYDEELCAISGIDIDDFSRVQAAKDYLAAGTECIVRGVPVRRLFILESEADFDNIAIETAFDETYSDLVEEPADRGAGGASEKARSRSGLLWLMRDQLDDLDKKWGERAKKNRDFALFGGHKRQRIIVTQQASGLATGLQRLCGMTTNKKYCNNTAELFDKLWQLATKLDQNYGAFKKKILDRHS